VDFPAASVGGVTYRFGEFTLDGDTRRLIRGDREVHVSPKAFELLSALVEHRTRAMARAELHALLWPNTFVLDSNLAGIVAELRRALEDPADHPQFIRTVPRFGYWFVGSLLPAPANRAESGPVTCWILLADRQIALSNGDNILGRAPDAGVWIDEASVSRHHARIRVDASGAFIEDLGSKNGTFLRGERVSGPVPLANGDELRLGTVVLTFRIPSLGEETVAGPD
jgi:DNA-binding winged helix-turn-helix (wHTH) protein